MSLNTLKNRLAALKAGPTWQGATWQERRRYQLRQSTSVFNPPFSAHGESHLRWVENTGKAGLRFVGYVRESRHRQGDYFSPKPDFGWYSDNFQNEALYPVVYQLPTRKGVKRFVYGYADPCNESAALLSFGPCDNENDAERWACSLAKSSAEDAREDEARETAKVDIEEATSAIASLRRDILALCKEIKALCPNLKGMPATAEALRARIKSLLEEREEAFATRAERQENFWSAVPQ